MVFEFSMIIHFGSEQSSSLVLTNRKLIFEQCVRYLKKYSYAIKFEINEHHLVFMTFEVKKLIVKNTPQKRILLFEHFILMDSME
jgi:hypothetical protein